MSYKNQLDPHSQLFHHPWTRRKHASSQINGETQLSQTIIKTKVDSKANRSK